jgi:hypothetical protein
LANLEFVLGYLLKGSEPAICRALKLDYHFQGVIAGKRFGISESIGRRARRRAEYKRPQSQRLAVLFARRAMLGE